MSDIGKIVSDLELAETILDNARTDFHSSDIQSDIKELVPILAAARSHRHLLSVEQRNLHDSVEHAARWMYGNRIESLIEDRVEIV